MFKLACNLFLLSSVTDSSYTYTSLLSYPIDHWLIFPSHPFSLLSPFPHLEIFFQSFTLDLSSLTFLSTMPNLYAVVHKLSCLKQSMQTDGLKTAEMYSPISLRGLKSEMKLLVGPFLSEDPRENWLCTIFLDTSFHSLPSLSRGILPVCLCLCLFFSSYKDNSYFGLAPRVRIWF